jgi:hypothetical protein
MINKTVWKTGILFDFHISHLKKEKILIELQYVLVFGKKIHFVANIGNLVNKKLDLVFKVYFSSYKEN